MHTSMHITHVRTHIMQVKNRSLISASTHIMLFYGYLLRLIYSLINSLFLHMLCCIQQWRSCRSKSDSTYNKTQYASKSIYVYMHVFLNANTYDICFCNWSQALLFDFQHKQKPSWPQNHLLHIHCNIIMSVSLQLLCVHSTHFTTSDHILSTINLLSNVIISGFNRC